MYMHVCKLTIIPKPVTYALVFFLGGGGGGGGGGGWGVGWGVG